MNRTSESLLAISRWHEAQKHASRGFGRRAQHGPRDPPARASSARRARELLAAARDGSACPAAPLRPGRFDPDPRVDDHGALGQDDDRVAVHLDDLGVRLDHRAHPQEDLLERAHVGRRTRSGSPRAAGTSRATGPSRARRGPSAA